MALNVGSSPLLNSISSTDRYGYEGLPPELAAEEQALNRKQQMANYLIQQGLQPHQGQMTGRFYVPPSPLQGLAGLAQMALGAYSTSKNDDARKDISGRSNKMLADAMQQYKEASGPRITEGPRPTAPMASPPPSTDPHAGLMPQPAQSPQQMELPGPGAPVSTPRSPEEIRQAIVEHLMLSQHPQAQRIGGVLAAQYERAQEHGLQREFLGEQKGLDRQNRIDTQQAGFGRDLIMASQLGLNKKDLEEIKATNAKALEGIRGSNSATVANINADSRENVAGMKGQGVAKQEQLEKGQENVQMLVGQLRDYYNQLNERGGITSTEKGPLENVGARIGSSSVGQVFGGAVGTKNQSVRDSISQQRPLLMQSIMKASGMTAKQMDSNVELKLWLSTATDPTLGYEANTRALDMLEKMFGGASTGMAAPPAAPSGGPAPGQAPSSAPPSTTQGKVRKYNPATGKIE